MKNKNFNQLVQLVNDWAKEKGILQKATPLRQHNKTDEEVNELYEALLAQANNLYSFTNSKGETVNTEHEVKDAIGDILVTLVIQCKLQGLDIVECFNQAYNIIKNRKGKMIDGQFVKE